VPESSFPRQQARTRRFTLGSPRGFRVAPDGGRVVFLRSRAGDDAVNCLWALDLDTATESTDTTDTAPVERLVVDPHELVGDQDHTDLPPEERARRERAREAGDGIVAYATDADVTGAVFALAGRLYTTDLATGETARLPAAEGVFDPRPSPTGTHVAYVSAGTLRVTSLHGGDHLVAGSDEPTLSYGVAEFVAAEEMRRSRGYWWAPDGDRLLVARVDESPVAAWSIGSPVEPWVPPHTVRYPAAGTANAVVGLEVRDLTGAAIEVEWNPIGEWEYLVDASWGADGGPVLVAMTRDQRCCAVLEVDPTTGTVAERHRYTDDHWIDIVVGAPVWIGHRLLTVEDRGAARRLVLDGEDLTDDTVQIRRVVAADDDGVIVTASTDATETHVFHVDLDGAITALTTDPGVHTVEAAGGAVDGTLVIASAGMNHDGWAARVVRAGHTVASISDLTETPVLTPAVAFHVLGERRLHTALVLPTGADDHTPLPVLLDPYGGPHAQRVQRARAQFGASQWFADQGFAVLVTDGRGTPAAAPRGNGPWPAISPRPCSTTSSTPSTLAAVEPRLDLSRVAIRGWSFGGYLAALAVLRRPDRLPRRSRRRAGHRLAPLRHPLHRALPRPPRLDPAPTTAATSPPRPPRSTARCCSSTGSPTTTSWPPTPCSCRAPCSKPADPTRCCRCRASPT
jgi:dipeptidyl-peptidase 4